MIISLGLLSAVAILLVMARINLKKFMGYPVLIDIVVHIILASILYGTYAGMAAAIIGSLFFSVLITITRRSIGYSRLKRNGLKFHWVEYEGSWANKFNNYKQTKGDKIWLKLKSQGMLVSFTLGFFVICSIL